MKAKMMKTAVDVILALESDNSRLAKEAVVQQAWDIGIVEFFEGAKMAYDPLRTFGVKKVPLITEADDPAFKSKFSWQQFCDLAKKLEFRQLTGHAARDALASASDLSSVSSWNTWYRRILLKDLKCGVTDTTINKILEKNGKEAAKYIIPLFSCQLAKNGEDHPKKMTGLKLLDGKLDGVRILSILDVDKKTVVQYTRAGRINENFPQISANLEKLLPVLKESLVFDGEMISKSFQALMKQLKRKDDFDTTDAKLALFDCIPLADFVNGECKLTQTQRHKALSEFQQVFSKLGIDNVLILPKLLVNLDTPEGQKTFKEYNREVLDSGLEGIMIKDPYATYKTKRTDSWLKIKPFITVDLEVIGFENGKPGSKFEKTLGGLICRGTDQGKLIEVTVGGGFSEKLRDDIWQNRSSVLGRIVELKGDILTKNQSSDKVWSLRFPEFVQFRGWDIGEKI